MVTNKIRIASDRYKIHIRKHPYVYDYTLTKSSDCLCLYQMSPNARNRSAGGGGGGRYSHIKWVGRGYSHIKWVCMCRPMLKEGAYGADQKVGAFRAERTVKVVPL